MVWTDVGRPRRGKLKLRNEDESRDDPDIDRKEVRFERLGRGESLRSTKNDWESGDDAKGSMDSDGPTLSALLDGSGINMHGG